MILKLTEGECQCRYVSVPINTPCHARARHNDCQNAISELRKELGDTLTASLLGIQRPALEWKRQPIPVVRAAIMLHLIVFANGSKVKLFDVLTSGRYANRKIGVAGRPQDAPALASPEPQGENSITAKSS